MLAWRAGFDPADMKTIDFRHKFEDRNSDDYGICVEDIVGKQVELVARETPGTNWGLGFFKYEACDYCDDIFAETADIAVGDAWLKDYTQDALGNSVVVVRNDQIRVIMEDGLKSGALELDELTEDEALMSQGGDSVIGEPVLEIAFCLNKSVPIGYRINGLISAVLKFHFFVN